MRLVSCLLLALCSSLVLGQEDTDDFALGFEVMVMEWVGSILDNSTESGFYTEFDSYLTTELEQSFCFDIAEECTDSEYLGCACTNAFKEQGDTCAKMPCAVYKFLYKELADILVDFLADILAEQGTMNLEQGIEILGLNVYVPLMSIFCNCTPGIYEATFQCIRNYDGDILEESGMGAMYRVIVGMLDLDSMQNIMAALLEPHCQPADGVDGENFCFDKFAKMFTTWGAMMDNTFKPFVGTKSCDAFKRVKSEFMRFGKMMDSPNMNVKKILKSYVALEKKIMCNSKCQETMAESFYGCCAQNVPRIYKEYELVDNIDRVVKNIIGLASMGGDMDTKMAEQFSKKEIRKFLAPANPALFCKNFGATNYYRQINDQCDTEEM